MRPLILARPLLGFAIGALLLSSWPPPATAGFCGKRCCTIDCSASPPRERPEREDRPPAPAPQTEPDHSAEHRWQLAEAERAHNLAGLRRYDEALAIYYSLWNRGPYPELERYLLEWIPYSYREHLKALLREKQFQHAERVARRALQWWPGDFTARYYLAAALRSQGRHIEALPEFARCASEAPGEWFYHYWHAEAHVALRNYSAAEVHFRRALSLAPERIDIHLEYAATLLLQDKNWAAIQEFTNALRVDPRSSDANHGLGLGYLAVGRLFQAEQSFLNATTLNPKNSSAWSSLSEARLARLDFVQAEKAIQTALGLGSTNVKRDYERLAMALAGQDKLAEAAHHLRWLVITLGETRLAQRLADIEAEIARRREGKTHTHGIILGTGAIMFAAFPRLPADVAERERGERMIRNVLRDRDGNVPGDFIDPRGYDFLLGLADSHQAFADFKSRVFRDQLTKGDHSRDDQVLYGKIIGRRFTFLDCHSNGAMICLTALFHGDATARHVRLFGPEISKFALDEWERLVRTGKIGSIEVFIMDRDPIPWLSYLAGLGISGSRTTDMAATIRRHAPSIHVTRLPCELSSYPYSFECHYMHNYQRQLARPREP